MIEKLKQDGPAIVTAVHVSKTFRDFWRRPKKVAVDGVSLSIMPGEVFGLLGPNGSGKSTTIKMLLGLLNPTAGHVELFGCAPSNPRAKARIGYLPELSHFHPYLTLRETLVYYAGLFNLPAHVRKERMEQLLKEMGIADAADRRVGECSKGMAQRVGLAQALLNDPDLVILDEPTSGLDPLGRHDVKQMIRRLASRGKTVLLSSHLLAEVEDVCDRVAILSDGRICAEGRLSELLQKRNETQLTLEGVSEDALERIWQELEKEGVTFTVDRPSMTVEDYFLASVGKRDRS